MNYYFPFSNMVKKVLVVDDDRGVRETTKLLLEHEGLQVYTNPGKNILQVVEELEPDVVLLDVWMEGIDGREVCNEIKTKIHVKPKVIIMTASCDLKNSAYSSGADEFIEKPFNIDHVVKKISSW